MACAFALSSSFSRSFSALFSAVDVVFIARKSKVIHSSLYVTETERVCVCVCVWGRGWGVGKQRHIYRWTVWSYIHVVGLVIKPDEAKNACIKHLHISRYSITSRHSILLLYSPPLWGKGEQYCCIHCVVP